MRYREFVTERSALEAWFSGSKVVNPDGSPKRMYHGTGTANDISAFSTDFTNPLALYGPGFYFTDSAEVAGGTGGGKDEDEVHVKADFQMAGYAFQRRNYELREPLTKRQLAYAKRLLFSNIVRQEAYEDIGSREAWRAAHKAFNDGEPAFRVWLANHSPRWFRERMKLEPERTTAPTVYPVYLRIMRPYEIDQDVGMAMLRRFWDMLADHDETFENASAGFRGSGTISGGSAWEWLVKRAIGNYDGDAKSKANEMLRRLGYDGIHHTGGMNVGTLGKHDVWIAFDPKQIKSVFARNYNPAQADISEDAMTA